MKQRLKAIVVGLLLIPTVSAAQQQCSDCFPKRMECLHAITPEINRTIKEHGTLAQRQAVCTREWERCQSACRSDAKAPPKSDEVKNPPPAVAQPKAPTPTGQSASCSDITGTGGAPAAKHCAAAKKSVQAAREARKASPTAAAAHYKEAAKGYRLAGDDARADVVMLEAAARDVAVFVEEEGLSDARKKNISEAESWARTARKIEEGAFESGDCGGLLVAADYYLKAGSYYLKADQFAMTNAILLRRDRLGRIVDEAKRTGACGNRGFATRGPAPPPVVPSTEERISPEDCRKILADVRARPKLVEAADETAGIVLPVELAVRGCRDPNILPVTRDNCDAAHIRWRMNGVKTAEVQRRRKLAGCPG